jgi:hypothetical protein
MPSVVDAGPRRDAKETYEDFILAEDCSKPDEVHATHHLGGNTNNETLLLWRTSKRR